MPVGGTARNQHQLQQLVGAIRFDEDSACVRPEAYRTVGRIADTLTHPPLLTTKFLIVAHAASTGRRENNLTLSQRRADVIREVLVNTFRISSKRLQAIGLGEEQLLDAARPAAAVNQRIQIATLGSALEPERPASAKAAPAPHPPTKPAKKPR